MKIVFIFILCFVFSFQVKPQAILPDFDETGRKLPLGVPRVVDTNGNLIYVDSSFTTDLYQQAACRLLLQQANEIARALQLNETLPLTTTNLVGGYVSPFGFAFAYKKIGNISTTNYIYGVEQAGKFSDVTITKIDDRCRDYAVKYQWPITRLDTNAALNLATQWLTAAHMNVEALNRGYDVCVDVDPYWNNVK